MNESAIIIYTVGSFYLGVFTGYLMRNLGVFWNQWGALLGAIVLGSIGIYLVAYLSMVILQESWFFTIALAVGFLIGLSRERR